MRHFQYSACALLLLLSTVSCSTGAVPVHPDATHPSDASLLPPAAAEISAPGSSGGIDPGDLSAIHSRAMLTPAASGPASYAPRLTRWAFIYYIPNRLLDFIDIFRFDIGFGVSYGAVARFTKYGQMGFRDFAPVSVRFGLHGRWAPVFVERFPEYGFGPGFVTNRQRLLTTTTGEFGLGADLLVVGAYLGLAFDELFDFVLGIVLVDFQNDDVIFQ